LATSSYYERTREAHIERAKAWARRHPNERKKSVDKYRFSEKGIRAKWNSTYLRRYGITLEQYEQMQSDQQNKCFICQQEETASLVGVVRRLAVDHCHKTGKVRRLLCDKCNKVLGFANDDIERLERIIAYLKEN